MVINSILEWNIERVVFSLLCSDLIHVPRPGKEVVTKLVEGDSHDPVCEVESLLNSVAMVNINVNVEHSWVVPAQPEQQQHNFTF